MSFSFQWPQFSEQFHADAIEMLNAALNKGTKPPVIADKIEVVELGMGTQPPELEIRDIGELTTDQFRGIFRMNYAGDAHLLLRTKVQANPLNHKQPDIHFMTGSRGMLSAKKALVVPMLLRLSQFRLSSYVVLVVSKQKGITLVFKTDPLQNVDINSTFDSIAVIQKFIQREIEGQLRQMFREDLPGIIHRLSQQWVKAKVEAPYMNPLRPKAPPPTPAAPSALLSPASVLSIRQREKLLNSYTNSIASVSSLPRHPLPSVPCSPSAVSNTFTRSSGSRPHPSRQNVTPPQEPPESSFPDIENFDPTYGLRFESLPTKSAFNSFGRLFSSPARGLADLAEESVEEEGEEDNSALGDAVSYGMVEWEDTIPDFSSVAAPTEYDEPDDIEYETLPAVGGGTITRPRIYHSLSQINPPSSVTLTPASRAPSVASSSRLTPSVLGRLQIPVSAQSALSRPPSYNPYFPSMGVTPPTSVDPQLRSSAVPPTPPLYRSPQRRQRSPAPSTHTGPSGSSSHMSTPPPTDLAPPASVRRASFSSVHSNRSHLDNVFDPWPNSSHIDDDVDEDAAATASKIVLRPALNATVSRLSTLSHSNHTLSPYARVPEHFAVRSGSSDARARAAAEAKPVHAKRKRLFRLGGSKGKSKRKDSAHDDEDHAGLGFDVNAIRRTGSTSPAPPSEFGQEEMDRYFRARENEEQFDREAQISPHARPPDLAGVRRRLATARER